MSKQDYGIRVFKPDVPPATRARKMIFFVLLSLIILAQCAYFLFANSVKPFVIGLPFSLFFVVLLIAVQFLVMLVLYLIESKDYEG